MSSKKYERRYFPTTHWSEVKRIGLGGGLQNQESFGQLLSRYLPPLKYYLVKARGYSLDAADDLLQGFILDRVIQGDLIAKADQERGKFRTLLLTALKNYTANVQRRKRLPDHAQSIVHELPDNSCKIRESQNIYEVAWAKQLVQDALTHMEEECRASGRTDIWTVFQLRVVYPIYNNSKPPSYNEIVRQFGFESATQACNIVITGKRMYSRILRKIVQEYVDNDELVELELDDLWRTLAAMRA